MKMNRITYILIIIQLCFFTDIFSQITTQGELKSNKLNRLKKSDEIPVITMPSFNVEQMLIEDKLNEKEINQPLRFAKVFEVDIDIKKIGLMEDIENLDKFWIIAIKPKDAFH